MTNVVEAVVSGQIFMRYQLMDSDAPQRVFGPMTDPEGLCLACMTMFQRGDYLVLVPLGPGGVRDYDGEPDDEAQRKAADGGWFSAVAVQVHYTCRTGKTYAG